MSSSNLPPILVDEAHSAKSAESIGVKCTVNSNHIDSVDKNPTQGQTRNS